MWNKKDFEDRETVSELGGEGERSLALARSHLWNRYVTVHEYTQDIKTFKIYIQ